MSKKKQIISFELSRKIISNYLAHMQPYIALRLYIDNGSDYLSPSLEMFLKGLKGE